MIRSALFHNHFFLRLFRNDSTSWSLEPEVLCPERSWRTDLRRICPLWSLSRTYVIPHNQLHSIPCSYSLLSFTINHTIDHNRNHTCIQPLNSDGSLIILLHVRIDDCISLWSTKVRNRTPWSCATTTTGPRVLCAHAKACVSLGNEPQI